MERRHEMRDAGMCCGVVVLWRVFQLFRAIVGEGGRSGRRRRKGREMVDITVLFVIRRQVMR